MIDFDALVLGPVRDTFAEPGAYLRAAGGSTTVSGVWQEPVKRQQMDGDGSVHWVWSEPSVGFRVADLAALPAKNDRWTRAVSGKTYIVVESHPDGVGWVNVILKATA